jgi:hypothetical protein
MKIKINKKVKEVKSIKLFISKNELTELVKLSTKKRKDINISIFSNNESDYIHDDGYNVKVEIKILRVTKEKSEV